MIKSLLLIRSKLSFHQTVFNCVYIFLLLVLAGCEEDVQSPGISVISNGNMVTTEAGGVAQFSIVLTSIPNSQIEIPLYSDNENEGLISIDELNYAKNTSIQFTSNDWHIPKTIFVRGVNDNVDDGDVVYNVVTEPALSTDGAYQALNAEDVQVKNFTFASTPGQTTSALVVTPSSALVTSENGLKSVTLQLSLNHQPSDNVTVSIASQDRTEGITQPNQPTLLVFTPLNWDQSQSLSITGVDDAFFDGDITYQIGFSVVSVDTSFNNLVTAPLTLVNEDDELVGTSLVSIDIPSVDGLRTSEGEGVFNTSIFTMTFNASPQPNETVTLNAIVSDTTEASISPSTVTLDSSNWQSPTQFTLSGVDDVIVDGDQDYTIAFSTSSSLGTDSPYHNVAIPTQQATNIDNDVAIVTVEAPPAGILTTEDLSSVDFTVVLAAAPLADVVISASSSNLQEGTINPSSLTFSPSGANLWNQAQTFTVTGVDDNRVDGDQPFMINLTATSSASAYNAVAIPVVEAVNADNDIASVLITLPTGGVVTSEDLSSTTFSVVLGAAPLSDVVISANSINPFEGNVSPTSLTFSATGNNNWNQPQTFTVIGVDDNVVDGDQSYSINLTSSSSNSNFDALMIPAVNATNTDNDVASVSMTLPAGGVVTSEDLTSASISVVLDAAPLADVVINVSSSNANEAEVTPASLTFSANGTNTWNQPQTVIVTGVDDNLVDGDQNYFINFIASSTHDAYNAFVIPDVPAINLDNDIPSVVVTLPTGGVVTSETLSSAIISVVLNTAPTSDVVITATSLNLMEGIISPASLTFSPSGVNAWDLPQIFTVTGVNDAVVDGDQQYTINLSTSSVDVAYGNLLVPAIDATNIDNDVATVLVTKPPNGINTSENLTSATFDVVLDTAPVAEVIITASSSNLAEATISPASLSFSPDGANIWNQAQTFTVTGVNDSAVDGDQTYTISLTSSSTNVAYNGVVIPAVAGINADNDVASVSVALPTNGIITSEDLTSATFSVVLDAAPLADVTISASSLNIAEGTVTPASLTFSPVGANIWNQPQSFTVTGEDDNAVDGSQSYTISLTSSSTHTVYNALTISNVAATNTDNDIAAISVTTPVGGVVTSENLASVSIDVVLDSAPLFDVVVEAKSSDTNEARVTSANLSFSPSGPSAWNVPQSVMISGVSDNIVDGDKAYSISLTTKSAQSDFDNMLIPSIAAINTDIDVATALITLPVGGVVTSEDRTDATISVVLGAEPDADVVVTLSSTNPAEGEISPLSRTFSTSGERAWDQPQTFTVTGVDDGIIDGDRSYDINFTSTSLNAAYNALVIPTVTAINTDNDTAPISMVLPLAGIITSENGGTDTFSIVLDSAPTSDVIINVSSSNVLEGSISPASLTFSPLGATIWNIPQTITVTGVDDNIDDGDQQYNLNITTSSPDSTYDGIVITSVSVVNQDDDTAGISLSLPGDGIATSESGNTDTFDVVLDSAPTADVTITATSLDLSEGVVSPASLTFSASGVNSWNQTQAFTVKGKADNIIDGDQTYSISVVATSVDAIYSAITVPSVTATNTDIDNNGDSDSFETSSLNVIPAGVSILNGGSTQTTESGASAELTLVLDSAPRADVVISPYSDDQSEAMVSPHSLTFTVENWQIPQRMQVNGRDDDVIDGDANYSVIFKADSLDQNYDTDFGLAISAVQLVNIDEDVLPPPAITALSYDLKIHTASIIIPDEFGLSILDQIPGVGYAELSATQAGTIPGPIVNLLAEQPLQLSVSNPTAIKQDFVIQSYLNSQSILLNTLDTQIAYPNSILPAGVYYYGSNDLVGRSLGQYGAIVVRTADGSNTAWDGGPGFNQERTWVIADMDSRWNSIADPEIIDRADYRADIVLINGETGFNSLNNSATQLSGALEELILVRIINAGQYDHELHFHGNSVKLISQDGVNSADYNNLPYVNNVTISKNSSAMILVRLTDLGDSLVHLHSFNATDITTVDNDLTIMRVNQ